jgi:glutaredoxin
LKGLDLSYEEKMFGKDFKSPEELYEAVGKQVRTMPQIVIDDVLVGGYNQLVEFMADKGLTNFKGEKI